MNVEIYYHIYLTDNPANWSSTFLHQIKKVEDFGLLDYAKTFNVVCIGNEEQLDLFSKFCFTFDKVNILKKFNTPFSTDKELLNLNYNQSINEEETLKFIWDKCQEEDSYVVYMHAKGITSVERALLQNKFNTFKNYYYWREFLEWGIIEKWETCKSKLDNFGAVGVNFCNFPCPHFSGNFWWSKSEYIRTLPDPKSDWFSSYKEIYQNLKQPWVTNRLKDEMWIGSSSDPKLFSLKDTTKQPPVTNLGETIIKSKEYKYF